MTTSEANTPLSDDSDSAAVDDCSNGDFQASGQKCSAKLKQHVNGITSSPVIGKGLEIYVPRVQEKRRPKFFCHIFYKTWKILMKFGM